MKLNIHVMSHPIIQSLCEKTMQREVFFQTKDQDMKNLGQLIIYETVRNWFKTYKINIRQIESLKAFTIPDPKESYVIIFSDLKNLSFFYKVKDILPNSRLILIRKNDIINEDKSMSIELGDIKPCAKIIILLSKLNTLYITELVKMLIKEYRIRINQIRLTSITCKEDELIKLSQRYSSLNIYTSRIVCDYTEEKLSQEKTKNMLL